MSTLDAERRAAIEALILSPREPHDRRQGLAALAAALAHTPLATWSEALRAFVATTLTRDAEEGVRLAQALASDVPAGQELPLMVLARALPGLVGALDPEVRAAAEALFAGRSQRLVYDLLYDRIGDPANSEAEHHWVRWVTGVVDPERLTGEGRAWE